MSAILELYTLFQNYGYKYSTDSRNISQGDIFFCLIGDKFDANRFAEEAKKNGASIVVTNREDLKDKEGYYFTINPLTTFQELSKIHAANMPAKKIIIGGSNGKTTTKELIACVLSGHGETHVTAGNFNNHIGVPITLLGLRPHHSFAVIEMGTNHPGEMHTLCSLVNPEIGIITNIGKEHLEGFGDLEAVAKEESEVFLRILECNGTAVINGDDPWINSMSKRISKKITINIVNEKFTQAINSIAEREFLAYINQAMPNLQLTIQYPGSTLEVLDFALAGSYNAYNLLFGLAIGNYFGITSEDCIASMQQYSPKNNRSEWRQIGNTKIFLDAYNANPSSMEASIRSFDTLPGKKIYFLGDMLELGEHSKLEHLNILVLLSELGVLDSTFLVGDEFHKHCKQFPMRFTNTSSLLAWLDTHPVEADYVFVKGSRGIKMENVLDHFQN